jgi:HEAT repeat protein
VALALGRLAWEPQNDSEKAWYFAAKRDWQELAKLGEPALPPLLLALLYSEGNARREAGDTLERIVLACSESAVPILSEALCTQLIGCTPEINQARDRVVVILGKAGSLQAILPLIRSIQLMLDSENKRWAGTSVRDRPLYDAQYQLVKEAIQTIGAPAVGPLVEILNSHDTTLRDHRGSAASMLGAMGAPAVDSLTELLESDDWFIRHLALSSLDQIGDSNIIGHLVQSLRDNHVGVRNLAAVLLSKWTWQPPNAEDNVYFLLARLLGSNTLAGYFDKTKMDDFLALGEQAVNPLVASLNLEGKLWQKGYSVGAGIKVDPTQYEARKFITLQLVRIGKAAIPALEEATVNPDPMIQEEAQNALKEITKRSTTKPFYAGTTGTSVADAKRDNETKNINSTRTMIAFFIIAGLCSCFCIMSIIVYYASIA